MRRFFPALLLSVTFFLNLQVAKATDYHYYKDGNIGAKIGDVVGVINVDDEITVDLVQISNTSRYMLVGSIVNLRNMSLWLNNTRNTVLLKNNIGIAGMHDSGFPSFHVGIAFSYIYDPDFYTICDYELPEGSPCMVLQNHDSTEFYAAAPIAEWKQAYKLAGILAVNLNSSGPSQDSMWMVQSEPTSHCPSPDVTYVKYTVGLAESGRRW